MIGRCGGAETSGPAAAAELFFRPGRTQHRPPVVPMTSSETMLIYTSLATQPLSVPGLQALVRKARERNAAAGITGLLLYLDDAFLQVLEGRREAVHALYGEIIRDRRHTGAYVLLDTPIRQRSFGDWSMGYAGVTRADLAALPGLSDFFLRNDPLSAMPPGLALALVRGFVEASSSGRWQPASAPSH